MSDVLGIALDKIYPDETIANINLATGEVTFSEKIAPAPGAEKLVRQLVMTGLIRNSIDAEGS